MPPTGHLTIPRADLTAAFHFASTNRRFIGTRIFTPQKVPVDNGKWGTIGLHDIFDMPRSAERNSDSRYNRINILPGEDSFATRERGLEIALDERNAKKYKSYFDFERFYTTKLYNSLRRMQEKRIRDLCHTTGDWSGGTNTAAATAAFSSASSAKPITDVKNAKAQIYGKCGATRFGVQMCYENYLECALVEEIRGAAYPLQTPSGVIPLDILANALGVEEVLIGDEPYNSADDGQTAVLTSIWPTNQMFVYALPEEEGPEAPRLGNTLFWNEDDADQEITVEQYWEPQVRGGVYRVRHDTHEKRYSTVYGFLVTGT